MSRHNNAISAVAISSAFSLIAAVGGGEAVAGVKLAAADHPVLRVCADPDNLPFSSSGAEKGVYVELAELIGRRLNAKIEYVWWLAYNQRRTLRNTLLAGDCDAYIALPAEKGAMGKRVIQSKPFMTLSYALVTRAEGEVREAKNLEGKRIGVQYGSTPQLYFSQKDNVTIDTEKSAEVLFANLEAKQIDAAVLWGPEAGYLNKTKFSGRFHVVPVSGEDMVGQVAIGVRASKPELVAELDDALDHLQADVASLAQKYGFPTGPAIELSKSNAGVPETNFAGVDGHALIGDADLPPVIRVAAEAPTNALQDNATAAAPSAEAGKEIFNNHCSHCHAPNAQSPVAERDLRRLSKRYSKTWREVAEQTIASGRPEAGMPTWAGVLTFEEIAAILTYLETVQN